MARTNSARRFGRRSNIYRGQVFHFNMAMNIFGLRRHGEGQVLRKMLK